MPECRRCGVALDWHEHNLCRECWDATEDDCDEMAADDAQEESHGDRCDHETVMLCPSDDGFPEDGWLCAACSTPFVPKEDQGEPSNLTAGRLHRYGGEYHGG